MAGPYFTNSLIDGDTMPASTLEAIETGFSNVDTDKANKVSGATNGNVAKLDANGDLVDAGFAASGELSSIAGLISAANKLPYYTAADTAALADFTAFARTILDDADAAAVRTTIDAEQADATIVKDADIGVNVQAYDAFLLSLATLGTAADKLLYTTAADTAAEAAFTAFARTLLDDADAATMLATLGAMGQGQHTIWIPAGAMTATTTNGAASGSEELATNDVMVSGLDFDAVTSQHAQFGINMPKSWDEGTIIAEFLWKDGETAGTGTVTWGIKANALGNDDPMDAAWGTAVTVTDTFILADDLHKSGETGAMTVGGTPAAEDFVVFDVYRDIADTYTQAARLIGVRLHYTTNAASDS